jgi:hypothetical protein
MSGPVQSAYHHQNVNSTNSVTLNGTQAGNTIVAFCGSQNVTRTFTVADGVNGAYNVDVFYNAARASIAIASFPGIAGGNVTITSTISGAAATTDILVEEWSGFVTPTPLDQAPAGTSNVSATTGTTLTTGTLAQANEVALAMLFAPTGSAVVASSPYTSDSANSGSIGVGWLATVSTAAQSATFTWTVSSVWAALIATYKLGAPAGTPPLPFSSTQFFVQDRLANM